MPAPLELLVATRLEMKRGKSVSASLHAVLTNKLSPEVKQTSHKMFYKNVSSWLARVEAGQNSSDFSVILPELQKSTQRIYLIKVLERGLKGSPIDQSLADLEEEFFLATEIAYDRFLQMLPLRLLIPLMLFVMPSVFLLLLGPLFHLLAKGMS